MTSVAYRPTMTADANLDAAHVSTQAFHSHHLRATNGQFLGSDLNVSGVVSQFTGLGIGGHHGPGMQQLNGHPAYMMAQDGHYLLASMPSTGHGMPLEGYGPSASPYVGHGQFNYIGLPIMPFTPGRSTNGPGRNDRHSDVPGLENRRGSYSTNESTPATPFYGGAQRDGPRIAGLDRSTYTTPSPQQIAVGTLQPLDPKTAVLSVPIDRNLDELLRKDPVVPKAVPAVFTPPGQMKTLEQSLENRIPGNRNVYIRGLHPTTDDALLHAFTSRFGAVETSKAIIDTSTGACKGFGFAKFFDPRHSELCIRGFHRLGYEVGFARESFNSRLKAEGDDMSTNLYISNLPKNVGEVELGHIFLGYEILSSKILRDSMGNSRGVGFARFEDRDVCDEIIEKFHGSSIGEEGLLMNIRYADTPAQKELKRITAERRQFRTNEYNIGAYGTSLVGYQPSMFNGQGHGWRRQLLPVQTPSKIDTSDPSSSSVSGSRGESTTHRRAFTSSDAIATPSTSSATDEGVTVHAEPSVANGSTQSSPSAKKEKKLAE